MSDAVKDGVVQRTGSVQGFNSEFLAKLWGDQARAIRRARRMKAPKTPTAGSLPRMVSQPVRIRLSRKKDWRIPPNTVVVSRPSKWGNPFVVGRDGTQAQCVALFRKLLAGYVCLSTRAHVKEQEKLRSILIRDIEQLRGKNLACWCAMDKPCHADVLLRLANAPRSATEASNE